MDSSTEKLLFACEILSTKKNCNNCWYNRTGHCSMLSVTCATQVFNEAESPQWWLSYEDGEQRGTQ